MTLLKGVVVAILTLSLRAPTHGAEVKTASAPGLTMPRSLLLRADHLLE